MFSPSYCNSGTRLFQSPNRFFAAPINPMANVESQNGGPGLKSTADGILIKSLRGHTRGSYMDKCTQLSYSGCGDIGFEIKAQEVPSLLICSFQTETHSQKRENWPGRRSGLALVVLYEMCQETVCLFLLSCGYVRQHESAPLHSARVQQKVASKAPRTKTTSLCVCVFSATG